MREASGNIWDYGDNTRLVLTTNGSLTRLGLAVPGNGVTRQAAERFPWLAERLGRQISTQGNRVFDLGCRLASFPVEETAWSLPDLRIIYRSAGQLRRLADYAGWDAVVVPRPGCGGGGLSWPEVRPLLLPWFDDRFTVIGLA